MDMSIYDKATNPYHRSGLEGSEVLLPAVGTLTQRAAPFILQPKRKMTTLLPCWLLPACVNVRKMLDYMQPGYFYVYVQYVMYVPYVRENNKKRNIDLDRSSLCHLPDFRSRASERMGTMGRGHANERQRKRQ